MPSIPDLKKAKAAAMESAEANHAAVVAGAHAKWREKFFAGFRKLTPNAFNDAELVAVSAKIGTKAKVKFDADNDGKAAGNADACNYVLDQFVGAGKNESDKAIGACQLEADARAARAERRAKGFA